jgi:glycosyltransferase involved in cell wall biosynthesis
LRIGLVIYGGLDLVSGGFLYDRQVVRGLRALGHEVEVVALPWRRFGGALAENLEPWPAGLDHCEVIVEDQLVHPAVFARHQRLRAPIVALVHNLSCPPGAPAAALPAAVERRYFATVNGVIAVCANTLAEVRALARPLSGVVARAGGDHVRPAPPRAGDGRLRVLFVGTVMPHKGLHRLLDALAPLPRERWTLDVVGSLTADPHHAALMQARAPDNVRFHGELGGDALWERHRAADVFALPSDREAYSLACLEALAFGLPVLVTERGGMGEMITGPEGLTLPPDRTERWTEALTRLWREPSSRAAMSDAARARHAAHGSWHQTAVVIAGYLRDLLARAPR